MQMQHGETQSKRILNQPMHKTLHFARILSSCIQQKKRKKKRTKVTKIISWHPPQPSFVTLNTDSSSKNNIGKVYRRWSCIKRQLGKRIKGFSICIGATTNNITEIWAARYG